MLKHYTATTQLFSNRFFFHITVSVSTPRAAESEFPGLIIFLKDILRAIGGMLMFLESTMWNTYVVQNIPCDAAGTCDDDPCSFCYVVTIELLKEAI